MSQSIIIDREFSRMIPPLKENEYKNLEESIRTEGCRVPIILWDNIIVDGHNRYEICSKLHIPFRTVQKDFKSRDEAISWICLNQLSRRNLSEEAFRYLVGKRYDAEKQIAEQKNPEGVNQYSIDHGNFRESQAPPHQKDDSYEARRTSTLIGDLYNLSHATVERYGQMSRSLDEIERKSPGLLPLILSGSCKISKDNIDTISQLPNDDINAISQQLHSKLLNKKHVSLRESGKAIQNIASRKCNNDIPVLITGVKTMPKYDPDAKVNEVVLTVPAWINEMDSLANNEDLIDISSSARQKLIEVLSELETAIMELKSRVTR